MWGELVRDRQRADRLREWRRAQASEAGKPAYTIFNDRTLAALAMACPSTEAELAAVPGIGPSRIERFGEDILAVLRAAAAEETPR